MEPVNIFGASGFIGSAYSKCVGKKAQYENGINDRDDYVPKYNNIVYFISTVDNYNVFNNPPTLDVNTNLITLLTVLNNIPEEKRSQTVFNFISSWFVYGDNGKLESSEDDVCNPTGFYSITKRAAEQLLISYCKTHGIRYRILRLSNIIGASDSKASSKKNALTDMLIQLKHFPDKPITLYRGDNIRDIMYIDDCVEAIDCVVKNGEYNTIYNIGTGVGTYAMDFVVNAMWQTHASFELHLINAPEFHKLVQPQDHYLNVSKLNSLGFKHRYDITKTITKTLDSL